MTETERIIDTARREGRTTLSEEESGRLLAAFGVPMAQGRLGRNFAEVRTAAAEIGYPVALKLCSAAVSHKTERGLVALDLRGEADLEPAFRRIGASSPVPDPAYLIQPMVSGKRELVVGMVRDPQLGPCVMFGLGGIWTEILADVTFRPAPLSEGDAREMLTEIRGSGILDAVRGMEAVDREALARCLIALGRIGLAHDEIEAIDVNPLIIQGSLPCAVDALVVLKAG